MSDSTLSTAETEREYGGSVTIAGRNLIASLVVDPTFTLTRIVVGSGKLPEGKEPVDMTDLVEPKEEATSTVPIVKDGIISLTVQYRNDMNGGLTEGFYLNEFGIYAKTDSSDEVLLYYATLGNTPRAMFPYKDNLLDVASYPVTIALFVDTALELAYNPGAYITSEDAQDQLNAMVTETMDNILGSTIMTSVTIPAEGWKLGADGWYEIEVPNKHAVAAQVPFVSLTRDSLATATECGLCASCEAIHGGIRLWARSIPTAEMEAAVSLISEPTPSAGYATIDNVVIPADGWVQDEEGGLYRLDVVNRSILASYIPQASLHRDSMETAVNCGLQPSVDTLAGALRFWAWQVPDADMVVSLVLFTQRAAVNAGSYTDLPIATEDTPGIIKASDTLTVDADGTAHAVSKTATSAQVDAVLDEVFGE